MIIVMDSMWTVIISVVSFISSFIFAYLTFKKEINKDITLKAKTEGSLLSDIKYIKSGIDKLEEKLERVETSYIDLLQRVIKLEEIYKTGRRNKKWMV